MKSLIIILLVFFNFPDLFCQLDSLPGEQNNKIMSIDPDSYSIVLSGIGKNGAVKLVENTMLMY